MKETEGFMLYEFHLCSEDAEILLLLPWVIIQWRGLKYLAMKLLFERTFVDCFCNYRCYQFSYNHWRSNLTGDLPENLESLPPFIANSLWENCEFFCVWRGDWGKLNWLMRLIFVHSIIFGDSKVSVFFVHVNYYIC